MSIETSKVVDLNIKKEDRVLDFSDFQKQNIKFDIDKLQEAYNQIVQTRKFDDGGGVTHFGAISLTQIPGDPDSIKGNKARGVYWTKPDKTGKEVSRDVEIDESAYSEFIKDYENTYFKEVFDVLSSKYKLTMSSGILSLLWSVKFPSNFIILALIHSLHISPFCTDSIVKLL